MKNQKEIKINKNPYITSDFQVATYLYSQDILLISIDWVSPTKAEFLFENNKDLQEAISKFWNGEAFVDAKTLLQAQKELKQRMYGSK